MGRTNFRVCNPEFLQPNVRRQATLNRDTESVVALTPNVELVVRRWSFVVCRWRPALANDDRTNIYIRALPAFDEERPDPCQRDHLSPLLMMHDRLHNLSRAPDYDGHDRNQPDSKVGYRSHVFVFLSGRARPIDRRLNSGGADRDRTGGLLVANQALSQLSYSPTIKWWAWVELNYRPHPYQGCALAN